MLKIDPTDARIHAALQTDCDLSLDMLGEAVGLRRNATWRRVRALEEAGVSTRRVALVDPVKLGLGLQVFMQIRTHSHDPDWQAAFARATRTLPAILSVYRMTGELD